MNEYNTREKHQSRKKPTDQPRAGARPFAAGGDLFARHALPAVRPLKQATITNIINEFIACGLVIETGLMSGSKGRRSIGISLNDQKYKVIGIRMTRSAFYSVPGGPVRKIVRRQAVQNRPQGKRTDHHHAHPHRHLHHAAGKHRYGDPRGLHGDARPVL